MLQKRSYSRTALSAKKISSKPLQPIKNNRTFHPNYHAKISKCSSKESKCKKIPLIINNLQKNLQLLKECYEEEHPSIGKSKNFHDRIQIQQQCFKSQEKQKARKRPNSRKKVSEQPREPEDNFHHNTTAELEELKKSYVSTYGYETNNIVELYNFYKKNLEKSTGLFGSLSYTNQPNSINNYSDVCESKIRNASGLGFFQGQGHAHTFEQSKQNIMQNNQPYMSKSGDNIDNFIKKNNDLVNVANLLAERKKSSRDNICQKMNTNHLLSQAKKRLVRPNTQDNIQRNLSLNENFKNTEQQHKNNTNHTEERQKKSQFQQQKLQETDFTKNQQCYMHRQTYKKGRETSRNSSQKKKQNIRSKNRQNKEQISQQKMKQVLHFQISITDFQNKNFSPIIKIPSIAEIHEIPDQNTKRQKFLSKQISSGQKQSKNNSEQSKKYLQISSPAFHSKCLNPHNSTSRSKSKSKRKTPKLSIQQSPGLNQGIIFQDSFDCNKNSSARCRQFQQNPHKIQKQQFKLPKINHQSKVNQQLSLDGCEISKKGNSDIIQLEDMSFDF